MKIIEFKDEGDFAATHAAIAWLDARGFSVGSMQAGSPRAIWHGDCYISKWRGLSPQDKRGMHAKLEGDDRNGPMRITLMPGATKEARAAFVLTDAEVSKANNTAATDGCGDDELDGDAAVPAYYGL
jgi:hypothetical protein